MLEIPIDKARHKCLFLPKSHYELNPVEMVHQIPSLFDILSQITSSTGPV